LLTSAICSRIKSTDLRAALKIRFKYITILRPQTEVPWTSPLPVTLKLFVLSLQCTPYSCPVIKPFYHSIHMNVDSDNVSYSNMCFGLVDIPKGLKEIKI
jgi:hypothetical protein